MQKVVIVIPIYQSSLSETEQISVNHLRRYCAQYPKVLVYPMGLTFNFDTSDFIKVALSPQHFKNVDTYNRLCLNPRFYQKFSDYQYMLIYQLDAYVFKDELGYWCEQNYSYIGAPWRRLTLWSKKIRSLNRKLKEWRINLQLPMRSKWIGVGNGGLCLRHIADCQKVLTASTMRASEFFKLWPLLFRTERRFIFEVIAAYVLSKVNHRSIGSQLRKISSAAEDRYFGLYGKMLNPDFTLPPPLLANRFSMEGMLLETRLQLNQYQTPFGAHGCFVVGKEKFVQHFQFIGLNRSFDQI